MLHCHHQADSALGWAAVCVCVKPFCFITSSYGGSGRGGDLELLFSAHKPQLVKKKVEWKQNQT